VKVPIEVERKGRRKRPTLILGKSLLCHWKAQKNTVVAVYRAFSLTIPNVS
jgi:hypothetical protein